MKIEWDKALEIETKVQKILVKQEINGIEFDLERAIQLVSEIEAEQQQIYDEIRPLLTWDIESTEGPLTRDIEFNGVIIPAKSKGFLRSIFTAKGDYSKFVWDWYLSCGFSPKDVQVVGPFTRIKFVEPELSKRQKLSKQLIRLGWKPQMFTETGEPMLTVKGEPVDTLEKIEGDIGKRLARWFTLGHRLGVIKGWIEVTRPDHRLTAYCTGCTTNTARRKHKSVN